jgi:hypothetical protein
MSELDTWHFEFTDGNSTQISCLAVIIGEEKNRFYSPGFVYAVTAADTVEFALVVPVERLLYAKKLPRKLKTDSDETLARIAHAVLGLVHEYDPVPVGSHQGLGFAIVEAVENSRRPPRN